MCKGRVLTILLALLALAGCSTLSVTSDYDSSVNFGSYHAYRWQAPADTAAGRDLLAANPIVARRVRSAVDRELAARGYVLREGGPVDFTVSAVATVRQMSRLEPDPVTWDIAYYRGRPYWHRSWWGDPWPTVVVYEEGALLLDITDARRRELAWRGVVRGLVEEFATPERMQARIDEAVGKLLSEFPPARR